MLLNNAGMSTVMTKTRAGTRSSCRVSWMECLFSSFYMVRVVI